eukprot:3898776-Lingulodinium_polyedra.AAC.1
MQQRLGWGLASRGRVRFLKIVHVFTLVHPARCTVSGRWSVPRGHAFEVHPASAQALMDAESVAGASVADHLASRLPHLAGMATVQHAIQ